MSSLEFLLRFVNGYRIVSTGDLTVEQIAEARNEDRLFVDEGTQLGWVALPWELSTIKDKRREHLLSRKML